MFGILRIKPEFGGHFARQAGNLVADAAIGGTFGRFASQAGNQGFHVSCPLLMRRTARMAHPVSHVQHMRRGDGANKAGAGDAAMRMLHGFGKGKGARRRPKPLIFCENQISLPITTAVSAMRFEKPHSLSYQARTEQKVPSITLVWSMWTTLECGSWLKSQDTFFHSV